MKMESFLFLKGQKLIWNFPNLRAETSSSDWPPATTVLSDLWVPAPFLAHPLRFRTDCPVCPRCFPAPGPRLGVSVAAQDPAKHGKFCPAPCSFRSRGWRTAGVPLMLPSISSPNRRRALVLLKLIGSYWKDFNETNAHLTSWVRLTSLFNLQSGTIQATAYKRFFPPNIHEVNIVVSLQMLRMWYFL